MAATHGTVWKLTYEAMPQNLIGFLQLQFPILTFEYSGLYQLIVHGRLQLPRAKVLTANTKTVAAIDCRNQLPLVKASLRATLPFRKFSLLYKCVSVALILLDLLTFLYA